MIIPIKCFTCGKVLADKWNYYEKECRKLEIAHEKKVKDDLEHEIDREPEEDNKKGKMRSFEPIYKGAILDQLGLNKMCCRRHMLTHIDMIDVI